MRHLLLRLSDQVFQHIQQITEAAWLHDGFLEHRLAEHELSELLKEAGLVIAHLHKFIFKRLAEQLFGLFRIVDLFGQFCSLRNQLDLHVI